MVSDKEVKKQFKKEAANNPDTYYPTKALKALGFSRHSCAKCHTHFWSIDPKRAICGDANCVGGFTFINHTPATKKLSYLEVWKEYTRIHRRLGYTPIDRYPVVARWREDAYFVQAGIYDFQPYVVTGEVEPPANPVVEPQVCLRFNDIDNVGITGAHYVCFIMLGEHAFMPPAKFSPDQYVKDHLTWLNEGMGLANEHIIIHEDAWAGGGNFGPCVEFFSGGLEISNQVYIQFEQTPDGHKELNLKVLDMGQGYERIPWFTGGESTSYESTFPTIMPRLRERTGVKYDQKLMQQFLPYASLLNVDEVENIDAVWNDIGKRLKLPSEELKQKILPLAALYSIAEHSRALLFALHDGALPSNVGGGYNLRVILRRALSFIDQFNWKLDLGEICEWHAEYLNPLFPELSEHLDDVKKVLEVEKEKYQASRQKAKDMVQKLVAKQVAGAGITEETLIELYDSHGISPELIREEAAKVGNKIMIPDNFYARVAERHQQREGQQPKQAKKEIIDATELLKLPETNALYYDDWKKCEFEGKVLFIKDKLVVLDQTLFYATSGGQDHDVGLLGGQEVVDVVRQGAYYIHVLKESPIFKVGSIVKGIVDFPRRRQLAQHHSSAHILNAAARRVLGNHINQAGAKKTEEKGHLDITHYASLSEEETKKIEEEANSIIKKKIEMKLFFMPRTKAEQTYGMGIYQGGVVPGKQLRIVNIVGVDVEACGGTHLLNTKEAEEIKILSTSKISDGVVRVVYVAGNAAKTAKMGESWILDETAKMLKVSREQVPAMAQALFEMWKKGRKAVQKKEKVDLTLPKNVPVEELAPAELLEKTAKILSTQPEHVPKTVARFLKEVEMFRSERK